MSDASGPSTVVVQRRLDQRVVLRTVHGQHLATIYPTVLKTKWVRLCVEAEPDVVIEREESEKKGSNMRQIWIYDSQHQHLGTYDYDRCAYAMAAQADKDLAAKLLPAALGYARDKSFALLGMRLRHDGQLEEFDLQTVGVEVHQRPAPPSAPPEPERDPNLQGAVPTPGLWPKRR